MLTTIYLFGELGHKFGRKWKLAVSSPAEAIRAIEANHPGILAYLADSGDRGIDWKVKVDGEVIGEDKLTFNRRGSVIRISPVVAGAKDKLGMVIVGAVLVLVTYGAAAGWLGGYVGVAGSAAGGSSGIAGLAATSLGGGLTLGGFVGALGISMALGGIAQMVSPQPGLGNGGAADRPSYLFNGPVNSAQQGGCVPLFYGGPLLIGSMVISAGIYSEDISASQRGVVPEGPFTTDPDYPDYVAPATPTNLTGRSLQTKQNARFLDALCEGKIAGLCDAAGNILNNDNRNKGILFEGTQVQGDDGNAAFNEFSTAFRPGSVTQDAIPGFPAAESETSVETEVIKGSNKIANAITRTISAGSHKAIRVSIRIPALYKIDDKGNRRGAAVHFGVHIKRSAESTWTEVVGSNPLANGELDGLIQGEATEASVWAFRIPLPGVGPWDVRVLKENADAVDVTKEQSKCVWQSYALLTDGKFTYRHTAVAATEVSAEKFASPPSRWFRAKGKLIRIPSNYNPTTRNYAGTWDGKFLGADLVLSGGYTAGATTLAVNALAAALPIDSPIEIEQGGITSHAYLTAAASIGATSLTITPINRALSAGAAGYGFDLKWTNNPAWILYDLCVEKRYGLGDYIPRSHVDRWALYTIARYCDGVDGSGNFVGVDDGRGGVEPRFTLSTYMQGMQDAYRVVSDIASAFRGMIYFGAGVISAVQDSPKDPRFNFHDGNVIEGIFNYSNTALKSRHTRARVQFSDPENFYRSDIETVDADDADIDLYGIRETSITAFGCTSRGQAQRLGKWLLLTEKLEKETVIFQTGMQGARARPGDIIRVRDRFKTTNVMAGRIVTVGAGTLTLDAPVTLGAGSYTLIVTKTDGTFVELPVTTGAGVATVLAVTGALTDIIPSSDWILRTSTLEPVLFRVLNVKELEKHIFELTGLRYASTKFAAVESGIVVPEPSTTDLPPAEAPASPASVTIDIAAVDTASGTQRFLTATWERSVSRFVDGYIVEYRGPEGEWREIEARAKGLSASPVMVTALGEHSFRVFTINKLGMVSTPPASASITVAEMDIPDPPTGLAITAGVQSVSLEWVNPDSKDLTIIEVQESLSTTFTNPPVAPSPVIGSAPAEALSIGSFVRGGISTDLHRYYRVRACNKSGGKSTWTSYVDATATIASGGFTDYIFKRSATQPAAPTGDTPAGWSDGPPAADGNPLWMSVGEKDAANHLIGSWSTPVQLDGNGIFIEYSIDGATSWHSTFTSGDKYMRQKIGVGGSWSAAIKIVGENGAPGAPGATGATGPAGINGLDGSTTFYSASSSVPTALRIGDLWFVTDMGFELRRATATGTGSWVATLYTGSAPFEIISGTTYIKKAAIREVDAGVIIAGNITVALVLTTGSMKSGSGASEVAIDSGGLRVGASGYGSVRLLSYDGSSAGVLIYNSSNALRGFFTHTGGQTVVDGGSTFGSANAVQGFYQVTAQLHKSFSSSNPRNTDAPIYSSGGGWIAADLDVRGVCYCLTYADAGSGYKVGGSQVVGSRKSSVSTADTGFGTGYNETATTGDFAGSDTVGLTALVNHLNAIVSVLNDHGAALNNHGARINDLRDRMKVTGGHGLISD